MNPLFIVTIFGPVFCAAGIFVGLYFRDVPKRGWAALSLLFLSALIWTFMEPKDDSTNERPWLLPCFTFVASVAVVCSFRARKLAPDRILSRAAFFGSFLIAAALLFMLFGMIWGFIFIISSHPTALEPTATAP